MSCADYDLPSAKSAFDRAQREPTTDAHGGLPKHRDRGIMFRMKRLRAAIVIGVLSCATAACSSSSKSPSATTIAPGKAGGQGQASTTTAP